MSSSSHRYTVSLYRYDLTQGMARNLGPMVIGRELEGIWHTSIVVYGKEYYFDGGVGIVSDPNPGHTRFGQPYRTEVLGQTTKREEEFFAWTQQQRRAGFGPNDYRILDNNCNSFSDAASMYLLRRHISQDVLEMIPTLLSTPVGQMLRPMLEQATSRGAGVAATGMAAPFSSPLASTPPPVIGGGGDACAGLLSTRQTVSDADEEDLMVAQAMLESNETIADGHLSPAEAFEKTISGATLLRTVILNVCEHPSDAKYRALSTESTAYRTKLKPLETYGVTELLRIAGFRRRPHSSGTGGEQWFLSDSDGSVAVLRRVAEVLEATIVNIQAAADEAAKRGGRETSADAANKEAGSGFSAHSPCPPPPPVLASGAAPAAAHAEARLKASSPAAAKDDCNAPKSEFVKFCLPPFPEGWIPLPVGRESGGPLFSIRCRVTSTSEWPYSCGKCRLSEKLEHLKAYYCSSDGREVEIYGGYEVLCVRCEEEKALTWVPAPLAFAAQAQHSTRFIFSAYGHFGVARAEYGGGVHPGLMEPSGRCVVPYGGCSVVVTNDAEVLCETARLPRAVLQELKSLERGTYLAELLRVASGQPIDSFDELLNTWQPPTFYMKPRPLRPHTVLGPTSVAWSGTGDAAKRSSVDVAGRGSFSAGSESAADSALPLAPRLLVCHDMGGGYKRADRRVFLCEGAPASATASGEGMGKGDGATPYLRLQTVEGAYTVSYWSLVDYFVYFSHRRISVPPREWIENGHNHGVPVLATLITESHGGFEDLKLLLTDARRMAAIIARLVEVCDTYGFDGYLLNIENSLPASLAKRLVVFCRLLRKQLNRPSSVARGASAAAAASASATDRLVIWYDAITIEGKLMYQNALTARNKPFFDVCDGIFTNYFWVPMNLTLTKTVARNRGTDVFVGVDVFGRHMYGGGGYNTHVAVAEAVDRRLSVALFAPGWTMECESKGRRDGFQKAEARMWSPVQKKLSYHARIIWSPGATAGAPEQSITADAPAAHHEQELCLWTSFQSGVGYDFYVNGHRVTGGDASASVVGASGWCEVSGAHDLPPFLFEVPPSAPPSGALPPAARGTTPGGRGAFAAVPIRLPATPLKGNAQGHVARAEWRYDKAWFGDCHLACFVPPMEAAEVVRWYVRDALPATSLTELHIEIVFDWTDETEERAKVKRGLRLGLCSSTRGAFEICLWETAAVEAAVDVEGVSGLVVRASLTREAGNEGEDNPTRFTLGWERVHYQLRNTSTEPLHLTSISVANGDPRRMLSCGVGGVAISHWRVKASTVATGADPQAASSRRHSVLCAHGPHSWTAHHTFCTRKTSEQVLSLEGADDVFALLRAKHGLNVSVVVFAGVASATAGLGKSDSTSAAAEGVQAAAAVPPSRRPREECHTMYVGKYSIHPDTAATYEGSLLIPVSLPSGVTVEHVYYYTAKNDC
ncbi:glycosyl hydrolase-like protein [Leishmania mexicana MHOM/GT/2001/U1103]|uniref:mannosyl-glycoprotein endo-beta-N-acetylglucosaminidase n=1 Tax=Leishmania mexicana (strain MHOM/GT/2001/U1103) TaxID=929439 RepID=E9B465_LEIMU|nr:glycosyl hydrolase-like protein [Leishmania mexicana MHOM/GT/2001/U1103]CBZ30033.1 glycosyl hydrolase-like protein [Leishmania mexicana MHOM/GT/2001/U1103]